jgi:hypothetical protein
LIAEHQRLDMLEWLLGEFLCDRLLDDDPLSAMHDWPVSWNLRLAAHAAAASRSASARTMNASLPPARKLSSAAPVRRQRRPTSRRQSSR